MGRGKGGETLSRWDRDRRPGPKGDGGRGDEKSSVGGDSRCGWGKGALSVGEGPATKAAADAARTPGRFAKFVDQDRVSAVKPGCDLSGGRPRRSGETVNRRGRAMNGTGNGTDVGRGSVLECVQHQLPLSPATLQRGLTIPLGSSSAPRGLDADGPGLRHWDRPSEGSQCASRSGGGGPQGGARGSSIARTTSHEYDFQGKRWTTTTREDP
jgi:hypothetical protein